jgi:hypothetical protein
MDLEGIVNEARPPRELPNPDESIQQEQPTRSCFTSFCCFSSLSSFSEDVEEESDVDSDQESGMAEIAWGLCETIASFFTSIFAYIADMFCSMNSTEPREPVNLDELRETEEDPRIRLIKEFMQKLDVVEEDTELHEALLASAYSILPEEIHNEIRKTIWKWPSMSHRICSLADKQDPTQEEIDRIIDTRIIPESHYRDEVREALDYLSSPLEQYPVAAFLSLFARETPADAETVILAFRRLPYKEQKTILGLLERSRYIVIDRYQPDRTINQALLDYLASSEGQRNHELINNIKQFVPTYLKVENHVASSFATLAQDYYENPLYIKEQEIIEAYESLPQDTKEKVLNVIYNYISNLRTQIEIPLNQDEQERFLIEWFASQKTQGSDVTCFFLTKELLKIFSPPPSEDV